MIKAKTLSSIIIAFALLLPSLGLANVQNDQKNSLTESITDDSDSSKVIVEDIIKPNTRISSGEYNIIASFTAVGISVDGTHDPNEPWIEHDNSPDINGTPKAHFYTSCDLEYVYLSFENEKFSDDNQIIAGELFIDSNLNYKWNEDTDTFLSFTYPFTKLYDSLDNPIEDSLVVWGDFIEIQIPITLWPDCNYWGYRLRSDSVCSWNPSWGNNTHPSATPPEDEFLNFTCIYWGDCECGIGFKGLADIWQIHPGECYTIYETDFENKTKLTDEWIAKSFDEKDDTWNLSTKRSHSGSYSFHCTDYDQYYGNALDVLEMKQGLDFDNVLNVTFSFWHWVEGDTYDINGHIQIADYGTVEFYVPSQDTWIPLHDLGLTTLYYDNEWKQTSFTIDKTTEYNYSEVVYIGSDLLQNGNKFRFKWTSDAQFQYEGWYIDDVTITVCEDEGYDEDDDLIWQSQSLPPNHWCAPWNSTIEKTFPLKWNAQEGKYLLKVCLQEEPPWQGQSCMEKIITVGDIHDVTVLEIDAPKIVEPGDDVELSAIIKNVGTFDEQDIEVHAKLRKNEAESPFWQRTTIIDSLNVSEQYIWEFTWEDATYCDYQLEVTAFIEDDAVPKNNTKYEWILVADTLFFDQIENECNWFHEDLTGGEGHWNICSSGYDDYLWCGVKETTKYGNNWNDVAIINKTFNLSENTTLNISFKTQYEIDENDFGVVEGSPDNGKHWYPLSEQITGYSDWKNISIFENISSLDLEKAKFRFRFFSNESITARGWIIDDISIRSDGYSLFEEDFDTSGTDNWIIERLRAGDWWQLVTKSKVGNPDNIAWWCGDELTGKYQNNLDNALALKESIDLTKAFGAHILFNTWYELNENDEGYIEISENDGNTWSTIKTIAGTSNGSWDEIWIPLTDYLGKEISFRFRFTSDESGNAEGWYIDDVLIIAKIDETPPTSTADLDGTMGTNNWYTSNIFITLSAEDEESGVDNIYFKLNDGAEQIYTTPISLTQDGHHTIEYWAVDNVNNIESSNTITVKIDKTDPEIPQITQPTNGIYLRGIKIWPLINYSFFDWSPPRVFGSITVTVDTSDETSGVNKVEFFINDELMNEDKNSPYEWTWDETVFFKQMLGIKVTDNAGNIAETTKEVIIFNINLFG